MTTPAVGPVDPAVPPALGPGPLVDRIDAAAYTVPTDLPEGDGTITWDATTLVGVHVHAGGRTGFGWTYASPAAVPVVRGVLAHTLRGRSALDVPAAWTALQQALRNVGRPGIASCALSAVDVALWDLAAQLLDVPAVRLLGRARDEVPVYGSGGFTTYDDATLVRQLEGWAHGQGIPRVKLKIGESWGRAVQRDLHRTRLARRTVGDGCALFVDANGGYTVGQAVRVGRRLDELDVTWFEEPVSSDDLAGLAAVRDAVLADVAAGEYAWSLVDAARLCTAGAVDCLQADATRCGGWTEWLRIAAVAAAYGLEVSAHCAPVLHTAVAAAAQNLRHVEWFHDHVRIAGLLFDGVPDPQGGSVRPDMTVPGHGVTLKEADAERYRVA